MIVLIDNYDSFTFNLFHYLGELGAAVAVHRNDKIAPEDVIAADHEARAVATEAAHKLARTGAVS